ncbi:unnamed protein product [Rotaria sp. Silwood1]|nr:unnamed protein product [Rotaria sp. Silwood1]CAF1591197.1 unnamed protein product [Rotaria sp. Silwood1]CAF1591673.1 unnamed protein product [Rotaria sp. Silwood1]
MPVVNLLLIDDQNMYSCPIFLRHLHVAIVKFHFYLLYKELVEDVLGDALLIMGSLEVNHIRQLLRLIDPISFRFENDNQFQ